MAERAAPAEDVELDGERQRWVLETHARLEQLSHYEILGVSRGADPKRVKRAYFDLVRVAHPDRYFGKRLGSFKEKLERIFARMTLAYETLSDPAKRAAYEQSQTGGGPVASGTSSVAAVAAPVAAQVAARKREALEALQQQLQAGRAKAAQAAQAAQRAMAMGDLVSAEAALREALRLVPSDVGLQQAYARVQQELAMRAILAHRRQAELEEQHGHWAQAAQSWARVLEVFPDDDEVLARWQVARLKAVHLQGG